MSFQKSTWSAHGATSLFVLLWSSGAIVGKLALEHASALAFLSLRFALAFAVLLFFGLARGRWLPPAGIRGRAALTGVVLTGCYSIFYLLALDHGVTPGVLATVLGVQPILTLLLVERHFSARRMAGLLLALAGLVLVVWQGVGMAGMSVAGVLFALAALASMTSGAILQKGLQGSPLDVLPLQYGIALAMCLLCLPFTPFHVEAGPGFFASLGWMALVISIGATVLLYRLLQGGNLVNVTSLFYVVPAATALLDFLVFGQQVATLSLAGMAAIVMGLAVVFREH